MNNKHWWIGILGGGTAMALGLGALVYNQYGKIETLRGDVGTLRDEIQQARQTLTGTAKLEREVIVLRENEEIIEQILPNEEDLNNFVRDLRHFEEDSEVRITGLKKKSIGAQAKQQAAFEPVIYTLTLEADAFQFLSFVDRVENHSRFMRVPSFKLVAAPRRDVETTGMASHRIQLDVETYAYEPKGGAPPVKIEGYDRKREFLLGEITNGRKTLMVRGFDYRGSRGRRDPWVDPRVPVGVDGPSGLTVEEQIKTVGLLVERIRELQGLWEEYDQATNVIEEMTRRNEVESTLSELEVEVRRIEEEGGIRFVPSVRRMELEVMQPLEELRELLAGTESIGPSLELLTEVLNSMRTYLASSEFDLALEAFQGIELRLDYLEGDPEREVLAQRLRTLADQARIAGDFEKMDLDIRGRALQEGVPPVVLIGGMTLGEGDLIDNDLIIRSIRVDEIEFIYRGVVLVRRF